MMRPSAMRGGPLGSRPWSGESSTRAIIVPHYGYVDKRSSVITAAPRSDGAKSQERDLPFVKYYWEETPDRVGGLLGLWTGAMRTSENSVTAKFVEWIFHALALEIQAIEKPGCLGGGI
jgi:hypothetical protein